ncbi:MAG: SDR family oxidoreductase [Rhodospirillales bacterium]|nr:SDR family oxidoreductase [Rhodospirillales bacterium]
MDLGLQGKRALVMGSTRGMGYAVAAGLVAEGAVVGVCGRDIANAEAAAKGIGDGARPYGLDLSDDASVAALISALGDDLGGLDMIVCNGGGPPPGNIAEVAPEIWMTQFQTMFVNQIRIVNAFLPGMRDRGWGRILVLSSSAVVQPIHNLGVSNTIRAGQRGWAKTLSNEVAIDGVTVNTLLPGRIHTSRVDQLDAAAAERQGKTIEEIVRASRAAIPMGRYGRVEEFADMAVFMLSDRAGYMTGATNCVDGGMIRSV